MVGFIPELARDLLDDSTEGEEELGEDLLHQPAGVVRTVDQAGDVIFLGFI